MTPMYWLLAMGKEKAVRSHCCLPLLGKIPTQQERHHQLVLLEKIVTQGMVWTMPMTDRMMIVENLLVLIEVANLGSQLENFPIRRLRQKLQKMIYKKKTHQVYQIGRASCRKREKRQEEKMKQKKK